jgi:hypothetical protein
MPTDQVAVVIFDMRCLQDPNYATRGIGRHVRGLLWNAKRFAGLQLIGLIDPGLPPVPLDVLDLLHDTAFNAYAAAAASTFRPGCFVSSSPMTHDPLWTARLMADPRWLRASVVYDFIPHQEPGRYLNTAADRLQYALQLKWLSRSDIFAPISHSTAKDLLALLSVRARDIVVTGCAIDPTFERMVELSPGRMHRHILVVGGGARGRIPRRSCVPMPVPRRSSAELVYLW